MAFRSFLESLSAYNRVKAAEFRAQTESKDPQAALKGAQDLLIVLQFLQGMSELEQVVFEKMDELGLKDPDKPLASLLTESDFKALSPDELKRLKGLIHQVEDEKTIRPAKPEVAKKLEVDEEKLPKLVYDPQGKTISYGEQTIPITRQRGLPPTVVELMQVLGELGSEPLTPDQIASHSKRIKKPEDVTKQIYSLRQALPELPQLLTTTDDGNYQFNASGFEVKEQEPTAKEKEAAKLEKAGRTFQQAEVNEKTGLDRNKINNYRDVVLENNTRLLEEGTHYLVLRRGRRNQYYYTEAGIQRFRLLDKLYQRVTAEPGREIVRYEELGEMLKKEIDEALSPQQTEDYLHQKVGGRKPNLTVEKIRRLQQTATENPNLAEGILEEGIHYFAYETELGTHLKFNTFGLESLETAARVWRGRKSTLEILRAINKAQETKPKPAIEIKPEEIDFDDQEIYVLSFLFKQALRRAKETEGNIAGVSFDEIEAGKALSYYEKNKETGSITNCEAIRRSLRLKLSAAAKDPEAAFDVLVEKDQGKYHLVQMITLALGEIKKEDPQEQQRQRQELVNEILTPAKSITLEETRFGGALERKK